MNHLTLIRFEPPAGSMPASGQRACTCEVEHCAAPVCPRMPAAAPRRALTTTVAAGAGLAWTLLVALAAAIACTAQIQMLRYKIRSNEQYLDDAARHGIIVGDVIEEWHAQLRADRRRLRELEA